jgi:membrane-bound metal-dependent hydrolase YbcI (DUF457 family)
MGRSHALSGWCAGLALAPVIGLGSAAEVIPFAAATAGYALLPDLDHPGAGASRLLGPITGALSWLVRAFSSALYAVTKGPRDEKSSGKHRHASHTLVAAMLVGDLASYLGSRGGPWAVLGVVAFGLLLAVDALGDWLLLILGVAGLLIAADWLPGTAPLAAVQAGLGEIGSWIGVAVAAGMFVHCLGDTLTMSGCPWLWPIPIRGETWYEIRPPKGLRFRTGGRIERVLVAPALCVAAVLLLPGAWGIVQSVWSAVLSTTTAGARP